jgi:hypothetical protein
MKINLVYSFGVVLIAVALSAAPTQAQVEFTGVDIAGDPNAYTDPLNWSDFSVPNLTTATTAQIDNGSAVTYTPGGDLMISGGGELEITDGSFTQVVGNNFIQLGEGASPGNGTILVDGGTFNQGTDSAAPFSISGAGNVFEITSGAANFNAFTPGVPAGDTLAYIQSGGTVTVAGSFNTAVGVTYTQSGGTNTVGGTLQVASTYNQSNGTVNVNGGGVQVSQTGNVTISGGSLNATGAISANGVYTQTGGTVTTTGEFDYNNTLGSMSGGVLTTSLITGINAGAGNSGIFTLSGGQINITGTAFQGVFGGSATNHLNFTLNSTGLVDFANGDTLAQVESFISTEGSFEYNNTMDTSAFTADGLGAESNDFLITGIADPTTASQTDFEITLNPTLLAVVPEPSTYLMMGLGLLVLIGYRKRFSVLG